MRLSGYAYVLIAAALWATLGIFYKGLIAAYGLPPAAIVFWRALIAALLILCVLSLRRPEQMRIKRRDWPFFLAFGFLGVAGFFLVYIFSIAINGVGMAAVLLYTAPAWVMFLGALCGHETLNWRKVAALFLAMLGAALVGQIYRLSAAGTGLLGLLAGLGAGLGYAAYILFSQTGLRRNYPPWTVMAYGFLLGALFMVPAIPGLGFAQIIDSPSLLPWLLLLGVIPTLGGSLAFNLGLQTVPATNASIVATLEPLIAVLLGRLIFSEKLDAVQLLGGLLIVISVLILQARSE